MHNYQRTNAILELLTPLIKTHGSSQESVLDFNYSLLVISAAIAEELGIERSHFLAICASAFDEGKGKTN